jgi:hypothetical protein
MAAAARFWDARRKRGGASASAFAPPLVRRLLSGSGAHGRCRCATARLVYSRSALALVAIPLMGLALHRNVLRRASIAVSLMGLALHRHALCKLSLVWLGVQAELSV